MRNGIRNSFLIMLITGCFFIQNTISQTLNDTIQIPVFEFKDTQVTTTEPFKKQVLDSLTLDRNNNYSLSEMLIRETPIYVKTYGSGGIASVSFRGTGASHTGVYWNGIAINSPLLGQSDFSILPTSFFNQAEIHYGLSSLIDGSGGLGGSIQLNNKPNWDNKLNTQISASVGSYENYLGQMKYDFGNSKIQLQSGMQYNKAKNNFSYQNNTKKGNPLERQENNELLQIGWYQNLYFKPNKKHLFSLKYNYFDSDRNLPKIISATENLENLKNKSFKSLATWDVFNTNQLITVKIAYINERLIYDNPLTGIYSTFAQNSIKSQLKHKIYFNDKWKLNSGIDANFNAVNSSNFDQKINRFDYSIYTNLDWNSSEKLHFTGLLRKEIYYAQISPFLPSLGLKYDFNKVISMQSNIAKSYRFPSFNDLFWDDGRTKGNSNLKPENGWSSELGFSFRKRLKNKLLLSSEITGFYSKIDNWIIWLPDSISGTNWSPENKKKVENKGVEMNFKAHYVAQKFNFLFSGIYSYTSSKNLIATTPTDLSANKQLIYVPYHTYKWNAILTVKKIRFTYNHVYTGKRFITSDNNWYLSDFIIGNIQLSYNFQIKKNNRLYFSFSVNNLWNKQYQNIASRPMIGRSYLVSLKYQFNKK